MSAPPTVQPTIDSHHHVWDLDSGRYAWPTEREPEIHRNIGADELAPDLRAAGVDATVLVQAADSLAETDSMLDVARAHPWIVGVVGWVPLASPRDAEAALAARRPGLHGIRHLIHTEPDALWLARRDVQDGLAVLSASGLVFDVVGVFPDHLPLVPEVADRHPDLTLVIDHLAKPPFRADGWDRWVAELRAAAARPNVRAKVSGLDTAAGRGWTVDEIRPAWDVALEAFGPGRLLFGSDWPVCRLVSTYGDVIAATRALVAELSPDERARVLGGTAVEVYRLSTERIARGRKLISVDTGE